MKKGLYSLLFAAAVAAVTSPAFAMVAKNCTNQQAAVNAAVIGFNAAADAWSNDVATGAPASQTDTAFAAMSAYGIALTAAKASLKACQGS